jgi:hypothetical protein
MANAKQREKTKEPPSLADQAERSLKEADRLAKGADVGDSANRPIAQMEQARVLALLELAQAVRSKR